MVMVGGAVVGSAVVASAVVGGAVVGSSVVTWGVVEPTNKIVAAAPAVQPKLSVTVTATTPLVRFPSIALVPPKFQRYE